MIDEKKIEEAKEEIFDNEFELYSYDIEYPDGNIYRMFTSDQLKRAISFGIHWAIEQLLKNLWHPASEEPNKSKSDILTLGFDTDDAYLQFKDSMLWQNESWRHSISRCCINQWAYLSDILPKQKGGE